LLKKKKGRKVGPKKKKEDGMGRGGGGKLCRGLMLASLSVHFFRNTKDDCAGLKRLTIIISVERTTGEKGLERGSFNNATQRDTIRHNTTRNDATQETQRLLAVVSAQVHWVT